jgi:hypothetical protein
MRGENKADREGLKKDLVAKCPITPDNKSV